MNILINYASDLFKDKQETNTKTGIAKGHFSKVFSFSQKDIDQKFFEKNKLILTQKKGAGNWLWKPYFILSVLESMNDDDYLFYCDSGAYFIDSIDSVIALSKELDQDIIAFQHKNHYEKEYTKRDTFILMQCDKAEYADTPQYIATQHLWKKTDFTIKFLNEWLTYAQDERIITDASNVMGNKNYPEFIDHRQDQSIFSLLCKKYKIIGFPDPSQFGNTERELLNDTRLIQFLHHTKGDKPKRNFLQKIVHEIKRPFLSK